MSFQTLLAYICFASVSKPSTSDPEKGSNIISLTPDTHLDVSRRVNPDRDENLDSEAADPGAESATRSGNLDNEDIANDDRFRRRSSTQSSDSGSDSSSWTLWWTKIMAFVFPPKDYDIESYIPHYRYTPIISGIVIPFSILLEIPGLTVHWYIRTQNNTIIDNVPNPPLLDVGLAFSMACAVLANVSLIVRFLERRVKTATIFCTVFLTIHDVVNIVCVTVFGVEHRFDDGFTYGESFWMTVCSTIASTLTNVTLIMDLIRTPDFEKSGSGLTRKQRSLVIIIIVLFIYIALGSLVNSLIMQLSFIDALFFTVISIETIGFGDIVPLSTGARIFVCIYSTLGIVNIAVVVGMFRETVMEGLEIGYRKRLRAIHQKRRTARQKKRIEGRWRDAIEWRLRERHAPLWVQETKKEQIESKTVEVWRKVKARLALMANAIPTPAFASGVIQGPHGMQLNLGALRRSQLEAAALEAGVPLDTLLPPEFYYQRNESESESDLHPETSLPAWFVTNPVYHEERIMPESISRIGTMAAMLTKFALVFLESTGPLPTGKSIRDPPQDHSPANDTATGEGGPSSTDDLGTEYHALVAQSEKKAFHIRAIMAWTLFIIFWTVGSAIFMKTEGWTYGISLYFCFIAFTTIGYGDYAPKTPAGRSIFVVWALIGVGTMTILISIVSEAYSSRYKSMFRRGPLDKAIEQYRKRVNEEYVEKAQQSMQVRFQPQESEPDSQVGEILAHAGQMASLQELPARDESTVDLTQAAAQAQRTLDALPQHVLSEARALQQYLRYLGDGSGSSTTSEGEQYVDTKLKDLLDDVVKTEEMKESTKIDILHDADSRRTLFALSVEKSLKELMNVAERALAAVNERNRVIAELRAERGGDSDSSDSGQDT
ncbi:hypothetical protein BJ138DRAFT_1113619 [Hygrophoropsis aurantiaca]|uniref:Uncharacterized protein n=1 Tax=Hygrophoropsis aurantiaca TaxID=72124 RepID=A0ACB8AE06_9AGAM|nr:hypothetical protein BJ138DRAFT_1113619 [Hygrophoropsis aurantiaca]